MDVSVIIINYNTKDLTLASIESVFKYTKNVTFEIILVDNASSEEIYPEVSRLYPTVKTVLNKENIGFGKANNKGIEIASGEFVFLLNSDAFLTSNALEFFVEFMRKPENQNVAVCGGELYTGRKDTTVSYGNFPSLFDAFSSIGFFLLYRKFHYKYVASGIVNSDPTTRAVDYINGAAMFIRKSVLDKVGIFDKDFFLYFEETELSYRIHKAGYQSMIIPEVRMIHLGSASQKPKANFNYVNFFHYCRGRNLYFTKCNGVIYSVLTRLCYALTEINLTVTGKRKGSIFKKLRSILFAS